MNDFFPFLRALIADPQRVAAVAPSSPALAELITAEITPASAPVIELGPGTGVFTRALLERGVRPEDLVLIESSADFAQALQRRFPGVRVLTLDAARLSGVPLFPEQGAGAVVSGLPLLSMPPRKIMAILAGTFSHLRPNGVFYQFTYGPRCPAPRLILERLGLKAKRVGGTIANIPPAHVYRIRRRPPTRLA